MKNVIFAMTILLAGSFAKALTITEGCDSIYKAATIGVAEDDYTGASQEHKVKHIGSIRLEKWSSGNPGGNTYNCNVELEVPGGVVRDCDKLYKALDVPEKATGNYRNAFEKELVNGKFMFGKYTDNIGGTVGEKAIQYRCQLTVK